jgi:lipoprotein LprG
MRAHRSLAAARLAVTVVLLFALAGCSDRPELPPADPLLVSAAAEMRTVSTVTFNLEVEGPVGALAIRRAEGVLTRQGDASAVVLLEQSGSGVEYEIVISGETMYVKGPTGGFQTLPTLISNTVFDPTKLMDPSVGVAQVLAESKDARTEAAESVDGADAYRVRATLPAEALESLLPVELGDEGVPSVAWIGTDPPLVQKLRVTLRLRGETQPTTMTVTLSDFNVPATITPPPT